MFRNSTVIRPACARCAARLATAAHVAAIAVPPETPPVLICSRCHAVVLTSADAATALRAKVVRPASAWQRAERLFQRGAA